MQLSILIPTLVARSSRLARLMAGLATQLTHEVEVLLEQDNGEKPSGAKRNALLFRARGEYVAFVDDDDEVTGDYVSSLLDAMKTSPDVITFHALRDCDGGPTETVQFGLHLRDTVGSLRMAANHLCAWKRSLATRVRFPDFLGYGDDQFWYKPLHAAGWAQMEVNIPRPLYLYHYSKKCTVNQHPQNVRRSHELAAAGIDCFWLGETVVIANRAKYAGDVTPEQMLRVYNQHGEFNVRRKELRWFATFTLG